MTQKIDIVEIDCFVKPDPSQGIHGLTRPVVVIYPEDYTCKIIQATSTTQRTEGAIYLDIPAVPMKSIFVGHIERAMDLNDAYVFDILKGEYCQNLMNDLLAGNANAGKALCDELLANSVPVNIIFSDEFVANNKFETWSVDVSNLHADSSSEKIALLSKEIMEGSIVYGVRIVDSVDEYLLRMAQTLNSHA